MKRYSLETEEHRGVVLYRWGEHGVSGRGISCIFDNLQHLIAHIDRVLDTNAGYVCDGALCVKG